MHSNHFNTLTFPTPFEILLFWFNAPLQLQFRDYLNALVQTLHTNTWVGAVDARSINPLTGENIGNNVIAKQSKRKHKIICNITSVMHKPILQFIIHMLLYRWRCNPWMIHNVNWWIWDREYSRSRSRIFAMFLKSWEIANIRDLFQEIANIRDQQIAIF